MKPQDFDFRLYVVSAKDYVCDEDKYQILADLKAKSEFMERNALKEPQVEVELFTGFYDKNGTKIYEGDIVSFEADSHDMGTLTIVGVVSFENGRFIIEGHENMFPHYSFYNFISRYKDIRIIGNIHINTELLGEWD